MELYFYFGVFVGKRLLRIRGLNNFGKLIDNSLDFAIM